MMNRYYTYIIKGDRNAKINALISFGGTLPAVKVKTGMTEAEAFECERALIQFHGRECDGGTLLNTALGGAGPVGVKHTAETRANMSAAHRGKRNSPEAIAKRTAAIRGKPLSAEHRAKISAGVKGKNRGRKTPEAIAKRTASRAANRLAKLAQDNRSAAL
jgi:hypothetical protein